MYAFYKEHHPLTRCRDISSTEDDLITHCHAIIGGLVIEVSGFKTHVKLKLFLSHTLWTWPFPKHWHFLEICFFPDETLWMRHICEPWWRHQIETFSANYWPFVRGIHQSSVNSPHKGKCHGALVFSLICLNKRLGKQSRRRWFETPSRSLWRHGNEWQAQEVTASWMGYTLPVSLWLQMH